MNSRLKKSNGVYLISPECADTKALCAQIKPLLDYPVAFLQYRNKHATTDVKRQQIDALLTMRQSSGVPLIINDDWQLALECGADGVHLGSGDAEPGWVRDQLGTEMLIGVSCYNSFERAQAMAKLDVDYLAFGAMFTSATKPDARRAALNLLTQAKLLNKPIVAIGGIRPDNSAAVLDAGADFIAVISGIFASEQPVQALQSYLHTFQRHAHATR